MPARAPPRLDAAAARGAGRLPMPPDALDWSDRPVGRRRRRPARSSGCAGRPGSIKWVGYTLLVIVIVADPRRRRRRLVVPRPDQPAGRRRRRRELHRDRRRRRSHRSSERLQERVRSATPACSRGTSSATAGSSSRPATTSSARTTTWATCSAGCARRRRRPTRKVTFPEGFTVAQMADAARPRHADVTAADFLAAAADPAGRAQPAARRA